MTRFLLVGGLIVVALQVAVSNEIPPALAGLAVVALVAALAGGIRAGASASVLGTIFKGAMFLISLAGLLTLMGGGGAAELGAAAAHLAVLGFLIFIFWIVLVGPSRGSR